MYFTHQTNLQSTGTALPLEHTDPQGSQECEELWGGEGKD